VASGIDHDIARRPGRALRLSINAVKRFGSDRMRYCRRSRRGRSSDSQAGMSRVKSFMAHQRVLTTKRTVAFFAYEWFGTGICISVRYIRGVFRYRYNFVVVI
jgi:hypothetical protein